MLRYGSKCVCKDGFSGVNCQLDCSQVALSHALLIITLALELTLTLTLIHLSSSTSTSTSPNATATAVALAVPDSALIQVDKDCLMCSSDGVCLAKKETRTIVDPATGKKLTRILSLSLPQARS